MKHILKYFKQLLKPTILAPTFKLLEACLELLIPLIVARIIDKGIALGDTSYIIKMVLLMVLCGAIGLGFSLLGQYYSSISAVGVVTKLRYDLFKKLQSLTFTEIDKQGIPSMITRMTSDVNQVQTGINLTLRLILRSPFVVFGCAIMGTILAPSISYIFWITIPVLSIVIFSIILITMPLHKRVQENTDIVLGGVRENLTGVRVIRANNLEKEEVKVFNEKVTKLEKAQNKVGNISNLMNPLTYSLINLAIVIIIYLGAIEVSNNILTKGEVISLYNYMSQILIELIKLANLIITISKAIACSNRIGKIFDLNDQCKILDKDVEYKDTYLAFNNVSFKYEGSKEYCLSNITFKVNKGDTIGIIGGTGSGKSTLVSLLTRFYDVTDGNIIFNNYDINSYSPSYLRSITGHVLQKAVLFKGTIKDNILWGNINASDEDVIEALTQAQAMDVVNKKALGINELIEQGGRNLSGGQRQRISIARAMVKKPKILIFDDSMSALDYQTDALLRQAIKNLSYKVTTFIISQRTSSIEYCDKIIVLDDGMLVGFDSHQNLLNNCRVYQEIYNSQFKKEGDIDE